MGDAESIRMWASAAIVRDGKLLVVKPRDENGDRYTLPVMTRIA